MTALEEEQETLVHGYTLGDVYRFTRSAVRITRAKSNSRALDPEEVEDSAYFGVVEHLYAADAPPGPWDLIHAGMNAIEKAKYQTLQSHGRDRSTGQVGPHFAKYWKDLTDQEREPVRPTARISRPLDDFTSRVVERLALPQVLAYLTPGERAAIEAIAFNDSVEAAAVSLNISRTALYARLAAARRRAAEVWFEHETPAHKNYGSDDECRHGHSRAEHGFRSTKGVWRCRVCERNARRRLRLV